MECHHVAGQVSPKAHFSEGHKPQRALAMKFVDNFLTRIKWQWVHRRSLPSPFLLKMRRRSCWPPDPMMVPPELKLWSQLFAGHVERLLNRALSHKRGSISSNTIPIEVDALKWLQSSALAPLPTDKDGGYCLVEKSFVKKAHEDILAKPWYCFHDEPLELVYERACRTYRKLAHEVSDCTNCLQLYSQICRSLIRCKAREMPRNLSLTIKTHKAPGDISCRNLHVGGVQPFAGLSAWLNLQIDEVLAGLPHLLRSSAQLADILRGLRFDFPVKLSRIDLKDFFMSGVALDFTKSVDLFEPKVQKVAAESIRFLCDHQFVVDPLVPGMFKVVCGSGMGLIHSSQLCDITFFRHAEFRFVTNKLAVAKLGIVQFLRFRDDILVVHHSEHHQFRRFLDILKLKAHYVKFQVDSFSQDSVTMLDLQIRVVQNQSHWLLDFQPHFKPTSLQVPLSSCSFHNPSIHITWPFNQLKRLAYLSSKEESFLAAKKLFVQRFTRAGEPKCLVNALLRFNPWPPQKNFVGPRLEVPTRKLWVVFPFHPIWQSGSLKIGLNTFVQSPFAKQLWLALFGEEPVEVGIAWMNCRSPAHRIFCDPGGI